MKKKDLIGFLQTYNKEADKIEFSITRLQMVLFTAFAAFFTYQFYITEENSVTVNSITLILVLLVMAVAPKMVKELIKMKMK